MTPNPISIAFILLGAFVFGWIIGKMLKVSLGERRPYSEYRENPGDFNKQNQREVK